MRQSSEAAPVFYARLKRGMFSQGENAYSTALTAGTPELALYGMQLEYEAVTET